MNPYLLNVLDYGPVIIERLLKQIEPHRFDEVLEPDRFSPREIVAHLADWEPILRTRLETAVNLPGSEVLGIDEGQLALENEYSKSDPFEQARTYLRERRTTLAWIKEVPSVAYGNLVVHNERGPMSFMDMANMLLGHDLYHIEQLSLYLGDKTAATW